MESDSSDSDNDSDTHSNNSDTAKLKSRQSKIESILELTNIIDRRNFIENLIIKSKIRKIKSDESIDNTYNYIAEKYKQIVIEVLQKKHKKYEVKFNFNQFKRENTFVDIKQAES
jgi:hypothetical protein